MNELSLEQTMTVKEVSDILNVSDKHIRETIKKLFPDKMVNGVTTYLNEKEVTAISLWIKKNPHLNQSVEVKTKLEKNLIIRQALQFLEEEKEDLITQNKLLTEENQALKPKALSFEILMKTEDMMSITDAAKHFNMSQKVVFVLLRSKGYLTLSSLPTQKAIDKDILTLKETVCKDNKTRAQAVVKICQLDNFYKAVK